MLCASRFCCVRALALALALLAQEASGQGDSESNAVRDTVAAAEKEGVGRDIHVRADDDGMDVSGMAGALKTGGVEALNGMLAAFSAMKKGQGAQDKNLHINKDSDGNAIYDFTAIGATTTKSPPPEAPTSTPTSVPRHHRTKKQSSLQPDAHSQTEATISAPQLPNAAAAAAAGAQQAPPSGFGSVVGGEAQSSPASNFEGPPPQATAPQSVAPAAQYMGTPMGTTAAFSAPVAQQMAPMAYAAAPQLSASMAAMNANMNMLMNMVAQQRGMAPAGGVTSNPDLQRMLGRVDAMESENRQLSSELREQDNRIQTLETTEQHEKEEVKTEQEANNNLRSEEDSTKQSLGPVAADLEDAKKRLRHGAVFLSNGQRTDLDKEESRGTGFAMKTLFHAKKKTGVTA